MTELVRRMRATYEGMSGHVGCAQLVDEAADAMERLQTERDLYLGWLRLIAEHTYPNPGAMVRTWMEMKP